MVPLTPKRYCVDGPICRDKEEPNIIIAETPETRKEASEEARPASAKRRGGYFAGSATFCANGVLWTPTRAYVENAVDATELLHAKQEDCQSSRRPNIRGEDVKEAVFVRGGWVAHARGNTWLVSGVGGADEVWELQRWWLLVQSPRLSHAPHGQRLRGPMLPTIPMDDGEGLIIAERARAKRLTPH